ncbi:MAG: propane monooxygenase reductase component, partial [Gaiellaceae bacterium]|nr:propane monooxygenase reductase component [Gaiellaceae bacterium]
TRDIRRLVVRVTDPEALEFNAGQYVDIGVPGSDDEHRSFSMANAPGEPDRLEFMIKLYEGGHFSGLLARDDGISVGDALTCRGPFGMFTLRDSSPRRLVFIAGGAGMAPVLSLLRSMAEKGTERPATFYYGARTADDLFALEEIERLGGELPGFRFVPALSEAKEDGDWDGEFGLVTDVVDRLEDDLEDVDAYLCGPPPMVDAAIALLERRGVPEAHIYFDRFTTTAA